MERAIQDDVALYQMFEGIGILFTQLMSSDLSILVESLICDLNRLHLITGKIF